MSEVCCNKNKIGTKTCKMLCWELVINKNRLMGNIKNSKKSYNTKTTKLNSLETISYFCRVKVFNTSKRYKCLNKRLHRLGSRGTEYLACPPLLNCSCWKAKRNKTSRCYLSNTTQSQKRYKQCSNQSHLTTCLKLFKVLTFSRTPVSKTFNQILKCSTNLNFQV